MRPNDSALDLKHLVCAPFPCDNPESAMQSDKTMYLHAPCHYCLNLAGVCVNHQICGTCTTVVLLSTLLCLVLGLLLQASSHL